jgi:DNA-binding transcriptional MerR regulator
MQPGPNFAPGSDLFLCGLKLCFDEILCSYRWPFAQSTISQMSRLFGVSLRTLRFYEDRGLIKPRREGNARFYRGADRVRMEMILKGKKLGFTLTEIQDLIGGKGATETPDLEDQLNAQQIVTQIGHLERQRGEIEGAIERLRATQSRLAQGAAA